MEHSEELQIAIYTTSTCNYCIMAKKHLESKGVKYTEYDVGSDMQKMTELIRKTGQMGVPVLQIGQKILIGFDRNAIDSAISALKFKKPMNDKNLFFDLLDQ